MANIPGYDQPNLGLQPTEVGIQSRTQAAYRGRALYDEAAAGIRQAGAEIGGGIAAAGAAAVQYESHREINAGAAHGAQLLANLTDDWNNTAKGADPNDPSVAKKWQEQKLEPALQQFEGGFNTEQSQKWAQDFTAKIRNHLFEKTTADMSSLAGQAVENNIHTVANTYSNTAINDPSAVPFLLDSVDHQIGGLVDSSPNIKGAEAGKLKLAVAEKTKEAIVKAGVYGAIQNAKDPEAVAAAWTKKYPQYINGAEAETFARAAKTQARTNLAMEKQAQVYQKQLDTMAVDQARNKIWADNVSVDADGKVTIKPDFFRQSAQLPAQHLNAPNATETARTMLNWGESQQKPRPPQDNPAAVTDLMRTISDPNLSADAAKIAVLKADTANPMTARTRQNMLQLAEDMRKVNDPVLLRDLEGAKEQIEPKSGGLNLNPGAYAQFYYDFIHNQYLPAKIAGTLPTNALDMNDPKSMISQSLARYRSPLAATITGNGGVGAVPAPAPAKTVALPPVEQRKAGQTYPTPRGPMKWTGTGWVTP